MLPAGFLGVGQNAVVCGFAVHRGTMKQQSFNQLIQNIRSKRVPFTVVFEITNQCNLKCLHCYQGHTREELTLVEIQRILGELAECGCLKLTLSGGEPTLREDFLDIFEYCHKLGFAITLFTNATRMTSKIRTELLKMTPYAVECSLYGASAEVHDAVTLRQGSFDSSLA
ncbi:MAG: radical SAM protein, partial [Desulfoferrobacter sp.]